MSKPPAFTQREEQMYRDAIRVAYGEQPLHDHKPSAPSTTEELILMAADAFAEGRQRAGWDYLYAAEVTP